MSEPHSRHTDEQGVLRVLACDLPPLVDFQSAFPWYDAGLPVIQRNEWAEVNYDLWLPPVLDQGSTPMCGGFATAAAHTAACQLSGRHLDSHLSPGWVYGYCREPLGGVLVRNCLTCLRDRGCPPVSEVGDFDTNTVGYSDGTRRKAREYQLTAAYQVRNFDELGSALQLGYLVVFGCQVGRSFRPGPEGLLPDFDGVLLGTGHAMYAYGVRKVGGKWYARVRNSWGPAWGDVGSCLMPESYFWTVYPGWPYIGLDAFAIRSVRQDALDADDLPIVRE